jgi:hypothetical protein
LFVQHAAAPEAERLGSVEANQHRPREK